MESILDAIVSMGIKEGPVPFQMTAKVMVQSLRKGRACNGKACKDKSFKAITCKDHVRVMHLGTMYQWENTC
jgi:hypothetical protein